jgi:hypothetical protein
VESISFSRLTMSQLETRVVFDVYEIKFARREHR